MVVAGADRGPVADRVPGRSHDACEPRDHLPGAVRAGALEELTEQPGPGPRDGTKPGAPARKASNTVPPARRPQQVTGPIPHALLTKSSPMGGRSGSVVPTPRLPKTRANI